MQKMFSMTPVNPHFDHNRVVWRDEYADNYDPVPYDRQFDGQWKLFLEKKEGFFDHTGVETSDEYIDDRIAELTGVRHYLLRQKMGLAASLWARLSGVEQRANRRGIGGRLYIDPKFPIHYFKEKRCLDLGCGAGRWTRTLQVLGATVKSVDMSEHALKSTGRFNRDVERLNLFDIEQRPDLHEAFDFVLCWGVLMCTHNPLLAFQNAVQTAKRGGELYIMIYAPTYHASEFVMNARRRYHRELTTADERFNYVYELAAKDRENAINYLDMLNTFYNWTIDESTIRGWCRKSGLGEPLFLNAHEPHKGAHHVLIRKP